MSNKKRIDPRCTRWLSMMLAFCALAVIPVLAADDGWIPLFNGKNLDGWYTYLESTGKNIDPKGVFKVEDGMIHILDIPITDEPQDAGYLATNLEYSDVLIHVEYKWGSKRFRDKDDPFAQGGKRDSGLLYLAVGPDRIYPTSLECQIEETDTGDLWITGNLWVDVKVQSPEFPVWVDLDGGVRHTQAGPLTRIAKSGDFEDRAGWNSVEVVLRGDQATHIVNDRIVNHVTRIRQPDPNDRFQQVPLKSGRILLEAEGSEIWFRNVKIKPLKPGQQQ